VAKRKPCSCSDVNADFWRCCSCSDWNAHARKVCKLCHHERGDTVEANP